MDRIEFERIERDARLRRAGYLRFAIGAAIEALLRYLAPEPAAPRANEAAERFMGLARFQDRLKNSHPPRIAVMRSIKRSRCSGTSTKFRRSLFTMSSGLSE